jgi:hypothetical protein
MRFGMAQGGTVARFTGGMDASLATNSCSALRSVTSGVLDLNQKTAGESDRRVSSHGECGPGTRRSANKSILLFNLRDGILPLMLRVERLD